MDKSRTERRRHRQLMRGGMEKRGRRETERGGINEITRVESLELETEKEREILKEGIRSRERRGK